MREYVHNDTYLFRAERFSVGTSYFGGNPVLAANAANLAEVLNILQHDLKRHDEFNDILHSILPEAHGVSVRPSPQDTQKVEIVVWPISPSLKRKDLTVPLNECGTGIGQVLAILHVVLTADYPRLIIIDEPQSFLHPGAARKLMDILAQFPQHQYVIATHSPTIISACAPNTITVVRYEGGVSTLEQVGTDSTAKLQVCLAEVGATPSDVFGADDVLWVEGATEEICFPQILTKLSRRRLMGTVIRGVRNTGDFEGKHAEAVIDIYNRLSSSSSLLPPAVAFVFDDDLRTETQKAELEARGARLKAAVRFTKRRCYENYLLHPEAIASVLNADDLDRTTEYTEGQIASVLAQRLSDDRYFKDVPDSILSEREAWVDAPKLLAGLFGGLTNSRVAYRKTNHSVRLTEWLLENDAETLNELSDMLVEILEKKSERLGAIATGA